ncbi:MAG: hypothetical protein PWP75_1004, partial [Caldanaerobacter sp.]|nr:hypothetical protein [Caldanaerobacter sp.]
FSLFFYTQTELVSVNYLMYYGGINVCDENSKYCVVDRFEEEWAVIEYKSKTFNFPKDLLPLNVREGDVIKFEVVVDEEETKRRKERIEKLADELFTEEE